MSDLLSARAQMGTSLAFHIIFALVGIGMPLMMVVAERKWYDTGDEIYHELAQRWARGTAILFAVGAVSGTVLSFELGLLWPGFMRQAGGIIGMPFSLEGFAFFTEAIFLGIYLYGWERISPRAHMIAGLLVAVSGAASGIFVVIANAWMNTPSGFRIVNGAITDVDPIAAMRNPAALSQTIHMTLAAYASTGLAVAGIHAFLLLRDSSNAFHRRALTIALLVGGPAAVLQPLSGDLAARQVARYQPAKLAAMEALFATEQGAPLVLGGWPDIEQHTTRAAIRIPYGLSLLAFHDPHATVRGLDAIPEDEWPNVPVVHWNFQLMVALGSYMALVVFLAAVAAGRREAGGGKREAGGGKREAGGGKRVVSGIADQKWLLRAIVVAGPMGFLATEAGWMTTEFGRQPWVIYGVLRTRDAVSPMPGLVVPFVVFTLLYCFLGWVVGWLLYRQILHSPKISEQVWANVTVGKGEEGRGKGTA
ncbi:MAG TPA: cytochrome ubiquinol oxidase subunit I [Gemmatimonadales bacterium]|nr:cytochrome ubiquinol oxidase subunit I [Gemmatimonadales bacterium]